MSEAAPALPLPHAALSRRDIADSALAQIGRSDAPPACAAAENPSADIAAAPLRVPRAFVEEARNAICHRAPARFDLLYRLLWRLRGEPRLMQVAADRDVHQLTALAKAVRRDKHKMTAFLRFREVETESGPHYLAWFEPQHHILAAVTPFFVKRFAGMRWSILTPEGSVHWDGRAAIAGPGARREDAPAADALEHHWRTYFASIFNPARLNTRAMKREMPLRYWKNMPEAALIPDLVRSAAGRTDAMLAASAASRAAPLPADAGEAGAPVPTDTGEASALITADAGEAGAPPARRPVTPRQDRPMNRARLPRLNRRGR
jgi:DNA polymerase